MGIEIDRDLAALLAASLPPHATVIASDFLETDVVSLVRDLGPGPARVAGNLPYNISSPILFKLIHSADEGRILSDATLMLQKEVAERLAARPDCRAYGALTVQVARVADVQQLFTLPPGAFRPAPTVSSAVVSLRFRRALESDAKTFERLVRGVFTRRRKTLANALVPLAMSLGRAASDILQIAQIDGRRRPEQLSPEEFARLSRAVL